MENIKYKDLLDFLTDREKDLLVRMYGGLPKESNTRAVEQIKQTLLNRNIKEIKEIEENKAKDEKIKSLEERIESDEEDLEKLEALENGGVDNWEWYGESLSDWFDKYQ